MLRKSVRCVGVVALVMAAGSVAQGSSVYFDGIFTPADWSVSVVTNATGVGSVGTGFQVLAGGNPNEYRRVRHDLVVSPPGNGGIWTLHLNSTASYNPGTQGAITSIDYSEDSINFQAPVGSNGQGTGLMIVQGGTVYIQRTPILVMPAPAFSSWQSNAAPGLVASDLWELTPAGVLISSSNPDFSSSGGVMQLGFWRGNSGNGGYFTDCGIDNWRVEIVPAPGACGLLAMGGLLASRRRR